MVTCLETGQSFLAGKAQTEKTKVNSLVGHLDVRKGRADMIQKMITQFLTNASPPSPHIQTPPLRLYDSLIPQIAWIIYCANDKVYSKVIDNWSITS